MSHLGLVACGLTQESCNQQIKGSNSTPQASPLPSLRQLLKFHQERSDDDICENEGLDAYFFLRYLKAIGRVFRPVLFVVMPLLVVLNYAGGRSEEINATTESNPAETNGTTIGLDVFAFGNVSAANTQRYACHALMAVLVTLHFCRVMFEELQAFASRRQKFLHRRDKNLVFISPIPPVLKIPDGMELFLHRFTVGGAQITMFRDAKSQLPAPQGSSSASEKDQDDDQRRAESHSAMINFRSSIAPFMISNLAFGENIFNNCSINRATSAEDIVWENVSLKWWNRWLRSAAVHILLVVMCVFWAIPVAATAALGQVDVLIRRAPWLSFVQQHEFLHTMVAASAGVLPGAALAVLLYILPIILGWLARVRGTRLHSQRATSIQKFCFVFFFIQMVLVVSVASFFTSSVPEFLRNLRSLQSASAAVNLLSRNLPTAANYFFSYLVMQALSRSAGTILQSRRLLLFAWRRWRHGCDVKNASEQEKTGIMDLASEMPIYTVFACIGLVYSIIAPLISVFVLLCFSSTWLTQRYWIRHTAKLDIDHGGILYPAAIHQTFVGVYVMLLCLAGLFFSVRDQSSRATCVPHGLIMVCLVLLVAVYQALLRGMFDKRMDVAVIKDDEIRDLCLPPPQTTISTQYCSVPSEVTGAGTLKKVRQLFQRRTRNRVAP